MTGSYRLLVLLLAGASVESRLGHRFVRKRSNDYDSESVGRSGFSPAELDDTDVAVVGTKELIYNSGLSLDLNDFFESGSSGLFVESDVRSRVIPSREYVTPRQIPGGESAISCSRVGEFHYLWSPQHLCMVCACLPVLGYNYGQPMCVSCNKCTLSPLEPLTTPKPAPAPKPGPEPEPTPPTEPVTCKPLPSDTPFQNPLNPCQVCVCREIVDAYGRDNVEIQCEENTECVLPTSTLPPITDRPVPMPVCQKFPVNVWFPHPNDFCKNCKCTAEEVLGIMEPHMTCVTKPECATIEPTDLTERPVPLPNIDPKPSPRPSPLPGPSPHANCQPFTPKQLFAHPWDPCLMCVCNEFHATGIVNIEINCYTKPECCELPDTVTPSYVSEWVTSLPDTGRDILSGQKIIKGLTNTIMSAGRNPSYYPSMVSQNSGQYLSNYNDGDALSQRLNKQSAGGAYSFAPTGQSGYTLYQYKAPSQYHYLPDVTNTNYGSNKAYLSESEALSGSLSAPGQYQSWWNAQSQAQSRGRAQRQAWAKASRVKLTKSGDEY